MGRGYSGNHPRFSHRQDERYDAKEAYNKDLSDSARLHYLENDRHDHDSPAHGHCTPMKKHTRAHRLRERAINISERSGAERGDEYDYENPKVMKLLNKANKLDERSGEVIKQEVAVGMPIALDADGNNVNPDKTIIKKKVITQAQEPYFPPNDERSGEIRNEMIDEMIDDRPDSPFNACAKSEGGSGCIKQMGGAWRVISNKTDKPWPAKYASKSKAEAALRGYHAG
tara:strand:+ start:2379 stop:3062 length:684 start_codon:yes stop_codon:yes gene_type:complete